MGQGAELPLRLLSPNTNADVWQYRNGQRTREDAIRNGKYLLVTMEGIQGTFFICSKDGGVWEHALPIAGGAMGLAVLLLIVGKVHRKKKKAKTRAEEESDSNS